MGYTALAKSPGVEKSLECIVFSALLLLLFAVSSE